VLVTLLVTAGCAEPRTPGDCAGEPDCVAGYRDAMVRLQVCIAEGHHGSPGPGSPPPPSCDKLRAEVDSWAAVVSRTRVKRDPSIEERGKSFDVPALPPSSSPP
jgi:hypothetical protein